MKIVFAFLLLVFFSFVGFYGFVGTANAADSVAEFKKPIADTNRLCRNDEITVNLSVADDVALDDTVRQRIYNQLVENINDKKKGVPCKTTDKRSYILNSRITGYYKKGQIARYFVPFAQGLHVDGDVVLILMPEENEPVAEFTMKTNLKHGHAGIEDAERVFARDIAEAIVVVVPITPVVVY